MKKPSHTRQPTPVRSAMRSIRVILPRSRTRVLSNVSLRSVRLDVSRISSPIAIVIYFSFSPSFNLGLESTQRTFFNILTLALIPSTSESFCDSSDDSTASEYWPLLFSYQHMATPARYFQQWIRTLSWAWLPGTTLQGHRHCCCPRSSHHCRRSNTLRSRSHLAAQEIYSRVASCHRTSQRGTKLRAGRAGVGIYKCLISKCKPHAMSCHHGTYYHTATAQNRGYIP